MGSKSNTWEHGLLLLEFNNVDFTGLGDSGGLRGSAAPGDYYVSLHTGDPGEGGDQTTNEISYGEYTRMPVTRNGSGGWTVTGNSVSPTVTIEFPRMLTGAGGTATHVGIGTAATGAGKLMRSGAAGTPQLIAVGVVPEVGTGTVITED